MAKFTPALSEKVGEALVDKQKRTEMPHNPQGPLFRPGRSGRVYGRGPENAR